MKCSPIIRVQSCAKTMSMTNKFLSSTCANAYKETYVSNWAMKLDESTLFNGCTTRMASFFNSL